MNDLHAPRHSPQKKLSCEAMDQISLAEAIIGLLLTGASTVALGARWVGRIGQRVDAHEQQLQALAPAAVAIAKVEERTVNMQAQLSRIEDVLHRNTDVSRS